MKRYFNTEGCCLPDEHYMVKLEDRLERIKESFVDRGKYFVINKGRQYGKTTTLKALESYLSPDYIVLSIDFQTIGTEDFADAASFVKAFVKLILEAFHILKISDEKIFLQPVEELMTPLADKSLMELFLRLSRMCAAAPKPIVLMIDEVDSASNNQVFLDFLAQLRSYYLKRDRIASLHSVILAGVYNIKNLKLKLRPESDHQYNSPWNIAANFNLDMSFSARQIGVMIEEYKMERGIEFDTEMIAEEIYQYTFGYPYLVSAICKYLDEEVSSTHGFENMADVWTKRGIAEAVKLLLTENSPLFGSMIRNVREYPELKQMLYAMLFKGEQIAYNPDHKAIELACMFGYAVNVGGELRISNRIFETRLYNFFLSEEELKSTMSKAAKQDRNQFVSNDRLDMELVLEKFVEYFTDIYGENDEKFVENYGRKFFLLYLKPIINGTGNYYIEAQTRDAKRTDIIVDYMGEQFVVEMKIWRGNEYNERGEQQIADYLDYFHQKKGYLVSFNFNRKKTPGIRTIVLGDKTIVEAVV